MKQEQWDKLGQQACAESLKCIKHYNALLTLQSRNISTLCKSPSLLYYIFSYSNRKHGQHFPLTVCSQALAFLIHLTRTTYNAYSYVHMPYYVVGDFTLNIFYYLSRNLISCSVMQSLPNSFVEIKTMK